MAKQRRKKYTFIILCLYWPTYFILAHIPLPVWTHKAGISDKRLHFLAYLILILLIWGAVKPYQRIHWRQATVWWILLFIVWYGVIDEWLQGYVSARSVDIQDFLANLTGAVSGLILLTFLSYWTAFLAAMALGLYIVTNCATISLAQFMPLAYPLFFLFGYMFFTLLWVFYLHKHNYTSTAGHAKAMGSPQSLISTLGCPIILLTVSQISAHIKGPARPSWDILLSLTGILLAVLLALIINLRHRRQPRLNTQRPAGL
jgi:VanZ family protein